MEGGVRSHRGPPARSIAEEVHNPGLETVIIQHLHMEGLIVRGHLQRVRAVTGKTAQVKRFVTQEISATFSIIISTKKVIEFRVNYTILLTFQ